MSRPHVLTRLVAAALLISLCSALFVSADTSARAAGSPMLNVSSSKISPDLQKLILSGYGDTRVKVIVHVR